MGSPFDSTDPRQVALQSVFDQPELPGVEMAHRFLIPLFSDSIHYRLLPPSLPVTIDIQGIDEVRQSLLGLVTILKRIQWWAERVVAGASRTPSLRRQSH